MAKYTKTFIIKSDGSNLLEQLGNIYEDAQQAFERIERRAWDNYKKNLRDKLENVCKQAVDDFYGAYNGLHNDQLTYNRLNDLENAYKIIITNKRQEIETGYRYMSHDHHQSNKFVFENSFIYGYHGGSFGTDKNGVKVDTPHYRTPVEGYRWWFVPAVKTTSPQQMIEENAPQCFDEAQDIMNNEILEKFKPYMESIDRILDMLGV